jgi:L-lactate dehydrogenase complex protein LldG
LSRTVGRGRHVEFAHRRCTKLVFGQKLWLIVLHEEVSGNRDIASVAAPHELTDVDLAIVRASFGVAETGSVLLSDSELRINAVAYLAQHLLVLLDPADILVNLHDAYQRPEFRSGKYACFHTGPSATADIEGVLIHGAQGVRSLAVLPVARRATHLTPVKW